MRRVSTTSGAAGLWIAAFNAKLSTLEDRGEGFAKLVRAEAAERLRRRRLRASTLSALTATRVRVCVKAAWHGRNRSCNCVARTSSASLAFRGGRCSSAPSSWVTVLIHYSLDGGLMTSHTVPRRVAPRRPATHTIPNLIQRCGTGASTTPVASAPGLGPGTRSTPRPWCG
jgi:hypothetical protein